MLRKLSTQRMTYGTDVVIPILVYHTFEMSVRLFAPLVVSFHPCQYCQIASEVFLLTGFVQCCTAISHGDLLFGGVMKHFGFVITQRRIQTVARSVQLLVVRLIITQRYVSQLCKPLVLVHVFSNRGMTSFLDRFFSLDLTSTEQFGGWLHFSDFRFYLF